VGNTSAGAEWPETLSLFLCVRADGFFLYDFEQHQHQLGKSASFPQSTKAHFLHEELGDWLKTNALHVSSSQWNACQWRKSRRAISGHTNLSWMAIGSKP
jgi:hypothetical protein